MNNLLHSATQALSVFLTRNLVTLSDGWWNKHVVDRLSFQQQRMVQERGISSLEQLDFAALIRVLDQNWFDLANTLNLPRDGRTWIKELQTVRNKWAHLSTQTVPASDRYRDADTLGRVLLMIGADSNLLNLVEKTKVIAIDEMSGGISSSRVDNNNSDTSGNNENCSSGCCAALEATETPISQFSVGELVALRSDPETLLPIIDVIQGGTENRYIVFQSNRKATYYESQLLRSTTPTKEEAMLSVEALHAHLTSLMLLSPSTSNLFSLRSGRVQFVPYQYRPVLKLIKADRPRLLIADEVGVGKTIEAGLIIKELRARMDISSVLIICPKALVAERKWFVEMKRFDENFTALDGQMLRHCMQETHLEGEWPEQYAKAIVPFSLFDSDLIFGRSGKGQKNSGLLSLDPPPKFDLVIVDEAHHIRNPETYLHQAVRYFCDHAQAVLFLTATPVQLGSEDLFTLLNVLRPDLVIDHASFEQMAAPNRPLNIAIQHCRRADGGWQEEALSCMKEIAESPWGRIFLRESPAFQNIYDQLQGDPIGNAKRILLIRALEELYTFSPLINRTRRRDIGEFTTRKPETLTIDFTDDQQQLHDDLLNVLARILTFCHGQQNVKFMMTTIRRQAASCLYGLVPLLQNMLAGKLDTLETMEACDSNFETDLNFVGTVRNDIKSLINLAQKLDPYDPKVNAFIKVLQDKGQMSNNKALVFSTFRHTLAYLEKHTKNALLRYGLVHGDVPDEERAELRRRFALPKENADALDVLLSSEVGCEGLDFQFCDLLINYDLPWNPMRIEQRIGRIDRYGQKSETVAIVNLITPGTVDAEIYERCLWRIGVFQNAIGGSEEILGRITEELHDIADSFTLTNDERTRRLQQLGDNGIRQIQEEQALEEKQAELFGLTVPRQSWRQEIQDAESFWLSPIALHRSVAAYLSGILESDSEFILGDKALKTLRLSQEARAKLLEDFKCQPRSTDPIARHWEKWLKGTKQMLPVTFEQETAVASTEAVHLNVLHPLVRQAALYLKRADPIHVNLAVESATIPKGSYSFGLYRWQKLGVKIDETLVAITEVPELDSALIELLTRATDSEVGSQSDETVLDALDRRHHSEWSAAQANHVAENRRLVEHRVQSLTISHRARYELLTDQVQRATNEKIRRMKEAERARAVFDFERRLEELSRAANSADIHSNQVVYGTLTVVRSDET